MYNIAETLLFSSILYIFYCAVFFPFGYFLTEKIACGTSTFLKVMLSIGISLAFYFVLISLLFICGFKNSTIRIILLCIINFSLGLFIYNKGYKILFDRKILPGLVLTWTVFLLGQITLSFPDGNFRNANIANTMEMTNLPVDALIPYNFSRYLLEDISFDSIDIVPNWKATDRGPLSGVITAGILSTFGLRDYRGWFSPDPILFYIYQSLLSFLNCLPLIGLWCVGQMFCSLGAARLAVLLLLSTHFFLINSIFAWPKFLMGFFILLAITTWQEGGKLKNISGVFLGLAFLSHDSAVFSIMSFYSYTTVVLFFLSHDEILKRLKDITGPILTSSFMVLPWLYIKTLFPTKPRGIFLLLFCNKDQDISDLSIASLAKSYFKENSWIDILQVRLANIWHPFNLEPLISKIQTHFKHPLTFFNSIGEISFFNLLAGLGLPCVLLLSIGVWKSRKNLPFLSFLLVSFGASIFVGIMSACPHFSVNHVWAAPAFIIATLYAGYAADKLNIIGSWIAAIGIGMNLIVAFLMNHYHSALRVNLHSSFTYQAAQLLLISLTILISFLPIGSAKK